MFPFFRIKLVVVVWLFVFEPGYSQIHPSDQDSLVLLADQKKWGDFNRKLQRVGKNCTKEEFNKGIKHELLNWLDYLHKQEPGRFYLREAYMHFASIIKKQEGFESANSYLLIANSYVDDPFCLDKHAWYIENTLATNFNRLDDLEKSEYYLGLVENALRFWGDSFKLSRTYTNLGTLRATKGKYREAEQAFRLGLLIASRLNFSQGIFANAAGLGELYLDLDSLQLAKKYQDLAFEYLYLTAENDLGENIFNWNKTQARYFSRLGNFEESICYFKTALEYFKEYDQNREYAKICKEIAYTYLNNKDFNHSKAYIEKGIQCLLPEFKNLDTIPKQNQLYQENTFAELFSCASEWYRQRFKLDRQANNLVKSVAYLELGLFGYEIIQGAILTDPSKLKIISSNRSMVDCGIEQLYQLKNLGIDPNALLLKGRQFFNYSKGLLLGNKSFEILALSQFSTSDKLTLNALEQKELELSKTNVFEGLEYNFALGERIKIQELKRDLFKKYQIQEPVLNYPENYIEYQIVGNTIYVMAKLDGVSYFEQIGSNLELQKIIKGINGNFSDRKEALDTNLLKHAYSFLFGFYKKQLPNRLCIIPDGQIQFIPIDALVQSNGDYIIERSSIYFTHRYGMPILETNFSSKSEFILAIRPEYPESELQNLIVERGNVYALKYTQVEVEGIQSLFGSQVKTEQQIGVDELADRMQSAEIVHFAGHAKAVKDSAYLILPGEHAQFGLDQLASLHSPWRMVVLSACETGLGAWEYGEGIRSLGKSFQEAGAQSVIMSLWSVNDELSVKIMTGFYKGLKKGQLKDEALRNAKLAFLKKSGFEKKHPYYWAGFVGYGDMEPIANSNDWKLVIIMGILILGLIVFINRKKIF